MRVLLTQRTLPGLVLGLLLLGTTAMGGCSRDYQLLLGQLQHQANIMQSTGMLLDPYLHIQGWYDSKLKKECKEQPKDFLSERSLMGLSRQAFLQTLNASLGLILDKLAAYLQTYHVNMDRTWTQPKVEQAWKNLAQAERFLRGFRNNIFCLAQLLRDSAETAMPTQASERRSTPPLDHFELRLKDCQLLQGYHHFMHSVGQVLDRWKEGRGRRRRHSPRLRRALRAQAYRARPSWRTRRPLLRRLFPQ
ncbi:oncostatin-M [Echinops telfairi]|uniref:Oncostatin-M n=1 Tax=Echinops telfairi TaxID=9371 RepID=A0AC55D168_ECHTE|nr:oncostatin-M [Echinops telfairi]